MMFLVFLEGQEKVHREPHGLQHLQLKLLLRIGWIMLRHSLTLSRPSSAYHTIWLPGNCLAEFTDSDELASRRAGAPGSLWRNVVCCRPSYQLRWAAAPGGVGGREAVLRRAAWRPCRAGGFVVSRVGFVGVECRDSSFAGLASSTAAPACASTR